MKISTLADVVSEAKRKGYSLENVTFSDIEVCADCQSVLFAEDEAYTSHNGHDALCSSCSVYCDECESYMTEAESTKDENDYNVCPTCVKKEQENQNA